jgi:hypothetical protein
MITSDPPTYFAPQAISETQLFLEEGDKYLKVVLNGHKRPEIFSLELLFNLLTLAIEKHAMAILMACGTLPENHTFLDLLDGLKWVMPVSEANHATLSSLHHEESMCSLEVPSKPRIPTAEQMIDYIALGQRMQVAAHEMVSGRTNPSLALE